MLFPEAVLGGQGSQHVPVGRVRVGRGPGDAAQAAEGGRAQQEVVGQPHQARGQPVQSHGLQRHKHTSAPWRQAKHQLQAAPPEPQLWAIPRD